MQHKRANYRKVYLQSRSKNRSYALIVHLAFWCFNHRVLSVKTKIEREKIHSLSISVCRTVCVILRLSAKVRKIICLEYLGRKYKISRQCFFRPRWFTIFSCSCENTHLRTYVSLTIVFFAPNAWKVVFRIFSLSCIDGKVNSYYFARVKFSSDGRDIPFHPSRSHPSTRSREGVSRRRSCSQPLCVSLIYRKRCIKEI